MPKPAEKTECYGEVFVGSQVSTVFFLYRDKKYMAQKFNGWQPKETPFFPLKEPYLIGKNATSQAISRAKGWLQIP